MHLPDSALAEKQNVTVPSRPARRGAHRDGKKSGLAFETGKIEEPGFVAESPVGLLKGNDVGAGLSDDGSRPVWIEPLVGADALVDVIRGDERPGRAAPAEDR